VFYSPEIPEYPHMLLIVASLIFCGAILVCLKNKRYLLRTKIEQNS